MTYRLFIPPQAVGASLVYFDLFNAAGSAARLQILSVQPIVQASTAAVGVVGIDLYLTRTTTIGTGGTAATKEGTSLTAATFVAIDSSESLPAGITARLTPTGGGTAGAVISFRSVFGEETNSAAYTAVPDMVTSWNPNLFGVLVPDGAGIRVVQGSIASAGAVGFDVMFNVLPPRN